MYYICKVEGKKLWDDPKDMSKIISDIEENKDKITGIDLSQNSIGIECAKILKNPISKIQNLTKVNYRDLFVSRLKEDLPISLKYLMESITDKKITYLDLSDNAFGPTAIKSFNFFLEKNITLKELHLENNGLGPEGSEEVANSLLKNNNMKLSLIKLNRNRLENKGAIAFSKVFSHMKSLEHVEIFQNGIKEDGMIEIIKSFDNNRNLKVIKINDNWIKSGAKIFSEIIPNLCHLKILDISDLKIGNSNAVLIFKSLSLLNEIEEIYSNYNETEKKNAQEEIFNILLKMNSLKIVEIKGNMINRKLYNKFKKEFDKKKLDCYSSEEEDLNEEEEEEEDEKEIKKEEIKEIKKEENEKEIKKEEIKEIKKEEDEKEIKKEEIKEIKKEKKNEEDVTDEIIKKMDNLDIHS
jgi:Ran GTPase-activating protein 1